jgi:hypothetical protein
VSPPKSNHWRALRWSLCALGALLPILIVWGRRHAGDGPPTAEVSVPAGWTMADLLRQLEPLGLRVVPANRSGPPWVPARDDRADVLEDGAFLTATDLGWDELSALHTAAPPGEAARARWRGTVFVRPSRRPPDTQPLGGGRRSALHAGRFHFYGDPDLLDRIEALLAE